jgi:Fatty acid cis/trans isomerase (CTI)
LQYQFKNRLKYLFIIVIVLSKSGCAYSLQNKWDSRFGQTEVQARVELQHQGPDFYREVKPILDNRCVVCHACYDAPCQLKLSSIEAIDRGASKDLIYDGRRLLAAHMSRMFVDAKDTHEWREKSFYPVLNERQQIAPVNLEASLLYRMLALKQQHPLPNVGGGPLPASFDFSLNRDQQCPSIEEFSSYERDQPLWGMPYGLPALDKAEMKTIKQWVAAGAKVRPRAALDRSTINSIARWEIFLNGDSNKQQLMSRYLYEHLFVGNIYFYKTDKPQYFKLVRSKTPPGETLQIIPSRRPFDDPGVKRVYYRFDRVKTTVINKTHMPYFLDKARLQRWQSLFLDPEYQVKTLPSYQPKVASNPFIAFKDLPVDARYRMMLDEAQFTIMGFIKGPVCRGQVALSAINDHFWVMFIDPDVEELHATAEYLAENSSYMSMPAEQQSNAMPLSSWLKYSRQNKYFLQGRRRHLEQMFPGDKDLTLGLIWNGDKHNNNAALTIFRHYDSASVLKGLVGDVPKTAWLIGYSLLERIHYLLVAGFDVYGNMGHQLITRLYMDFLRLEGESNFMMMMPEPFGGQEFRRWYEGSESSMKDYVAGIEYRGSTSLGIHYQSDNPKQEFFTMVQKVIGENIIPADRINRDPQRPLERQLHAIAQISGKVLSHMPELTFMRLRIDNSEDRVYSLIKNRAHTNVSSLFGEEKRIVAEQQTLSVIEGIVGSYPNAYLDLRVLQLQDLQQSLASLASEQDYRQMLSRYGVRRNNPGFWPFNDWLHKYFQQQSPLQAGLLDLNRFENR